MTTEPVRWFDWGEEAFRRARETDRPILLSIVVSWDHWCRVTEREIWGDPEIAEIVNREYVPIRVDADRRPDIHERYHAGGWPTTAFLGPDGGLLWGVTSVPPHQMRQVLVRFREGFATQRTRLAEAVRARDEKVAQIRLGMYEGRLMPGPDVLRRTVEGIVKEFDPLNGGFGASPKFPMHSSLEVLLLALSRGPDAKIQGRVERTLDAMASRGLRDAVEGGFHRLCTKDGWSGARTEKLAIDNARHIRLYLQAFRVLRLDRYRDVARSVLAWADRVLWDPERGAYRSSQAADDEYFGLDRAGRAARQAPPVDRTLLTVANAEFAVALAEGAGVIGDPVDLNERAQAILTRVGRPEVHPDQGPPRYEDLDAGGFGMLQEPVALANALLAVGAGDGIPPARKLLEWAWKEFWSEEEGGLLDRRPGFEELGELRMRRSSVQENALACLAAVRLAERTKEPLWADRAEQVLSRMPDFGKDYGPQTAEVAVAVDALLRHRG